MPDQKYEYWGNCACLKGDLIFDMVDTEEELSWEEFLENVNLEDIKEIFPDYDWDEESDGLHLWNDWAVSFHKSEYNEMECVYISYSSMEYVFTKNCFDCDDGIITESCGLCNGTGEGCANGTICISCN